MLLEMWWKRLGSFLCLYYFNSYFHSKFDFGSICLFEERLTAIVLFLSVKKQSTTLYAYDMQTHVHVELSSQPVAMQYTLDITRHMIFKYARVLNNIILQNSSALTYMTFRLVYKKKPANLRSPFILCKLRIFQNQQLLPVNIFWQSSFRILKIYY